MPRAILPTPCTQALSHADADGCDSASTCRVHERLDALAPFARVSLRRQLPLAELLGGFYECVPEGLVSVFGCQELELLLCGLRAG